MNIPQYKNDFITPRQLILPDSAPKFTYDSHFLCSIAVGGHTWLVKPLRKGHRWGTEIICNRQLLVANAFEEILQERLPRFHAVVRRNYNKIGRGLHKHYGIFGKPLVADAVYVLMKPVEWCFVAVLYTFDRKPEERIERQYL